MPTQAHPRVKKRLPCAIEVEGSRHQGITLNLSRGGLYVQTDAGLGVGSPIDVELTASRLGSIPLQGSVVWRKAVPRSLRGVSHGGFGVRIVSPPGAYESLVEELLGENLPPSRPASGVIPAAYRVRLRFGETQRSRTLVVVSATEDEARRAALDQQGNGWRVLDLARMV